MSARTTSSLPTGASASVRIETKLLEDESDNPVLDFGADGVLTVKAGTRVGVEAPAVNLPGATFAASGASLGAVTVAGHTGLASLSATTITAASVATTVITATDELQVSAKSVSIPGAVQVDGVVMSSEDAMVSQSPIVVLGAGGSSSGIVVAGAPQNLPLGELPADYEQSIRWQRNDGDGMSAGPRRPQWAFGGGCVSMAGADDSEWVIAPTVDKATGDASLGMFREVPGEEAEVELVQTFAVDPQSGPGTVYDAAKKTIGGDTVLPKGWSVASGGHAAEATPVQLFSPLASRAIEYGLYASAGTASLDITAPVDVRLTKLELWSHTSSLFQGHLAIDGLEVHATDDPTWATSVRIHIADGAQARPPTLPYSIEPQGSVGRTVATANFKNGWDESLDHATVLVTPAQRAYRYFRIQFVTTGTVHLGAMRVEYVEVTPFIRLDARELPDLISGDVVSEWGPFSQEIGAVRPTYNADGHVEFRNQFLHVPGGLTLDTGLYGGLTMITRVRWTAPGAFARLFDFGDLNNSELFIALAGNSMSILSGTHTPASISFELGVWTTIVTVHDYVDGGEAVDRWYKDGVLMETLSVDRRASQAYTLAQIGNSSSRDKIVTNMDLSHMSFYHGAMSDNQIVAALARIQYKDAAELLRLDARELSYLDTGDAVTAWGDRYVQGDEAVQPRYNSAGHVEFREQWMSIPGGITLQADLHGGFTTIARVRWRASTGARVWPRLYDIGDTNQNYDADGGMIALSGDTMQLSLARMDNPNGAGLKLDTWTTLVTVHEYTDDGGATNSWYKDGVLMETSSNRNRIVQQTYAHALIGKSVFGNNTLANMDLSHLSFYNGAMPWASIEEILAALQTSVPSAALRLDARELSYLAEGDAVSKWGKQFAQDDVTVQPRYSSEGHVEFHNQYLAIPGGVTLQTSLYAGYTTVTRVRWLTGGTWARLFDFGSFRDSKIELGLRDNRLLVTGVENRTATAFELGVWTTIVTVHAYTDDGNAIDKWYKDGVLMDTSTDRPRVVTATYPLAHIGLSSHLGAANSIMDVSHFSLYNGAMTEAQIAAALVDVVPQVAPVPAIRIDARDLSQSAQGEPVAIWGPYVQDDSASQPHYNSDGHVEFRGDFIAVPGGATLPFAEHGGLTTVSRVRWISHGTNARLYDFANHKRNQMYISFDGFSTKVSGVRNPDQVTFELGVWTTIAVVHEYTDDGLAVERWYKDGELMNAAVGIPRLATVTCRSARLGIDDYDTPPNSFMDVSHFSLYHGVLPEAQLQVVLTDITPVRVPLASAKTPLMVIDATSLEEVGGTILHDRSDRGVAIGKSKGVTIVEHPASIGSGASRAFRYLSGGTADGLVIPNYIMPDGEYTFVHLTRYGEGARQRIWQSTEGNYISGHHGGSTCNMYHERWMIQARVQTPDEWLLTVDQRDNGRFNGGQLTGSAAGSTPSDWAINLRTGREESAWNVAEFMLFEGNLDAADIVAVEAYFSEKYGLAALFLNAVLTVAGDEPAFAGLADGDAVSSWGQGALTQGDVAFKPVYVSAGSVRFIDTRHLVCDTVALNIATGGAFIASVRVMFHNDVSSCLVFAFHNDDANRRVLLEKIDSNLVMKVGALEMTAAPVMVGEWVTLLVHYDATTAVTTTFADGVETNTQALSVMDDTIFEYMTLGGTVGTDMEISHASFYTHKPDVATVTYAPDVSGGALSLRLGDALTTPLLTSESVTPVTSIVADGDIPPGLELQGDRLVGTLASVKAYDLTISAVVQNLPKEFGRSVLTYRQDVGVTGIGGEFGLPDDVVVVEESGSHAGHTPDRMFTRANTGYWHSLAHGIVDNKPPTVTVTFPSPTTITHVRIWAAAQHSNTAGYRYIRGLRVYGNGALLAEESFLQPAPSSSDDDWTELNAGSSVTLPRPGAYTEYTIVVPSVDKYVSLGHAQLLNVPIGPSIPETLFVPTPAWDSQAHVVYVSARSGRPTSIAASAGSYSVIEGSLPTGLALDDQGGALAFDQSVAAPASDTPVTLKTNVSSGQGGYASATRRVVLSVTDALFKLTTAELDYGALEHGAQVSQWGGLVQSDAALTPVYDAARFVTVSGSRRLEVTSPVGIPLAVGGGFTLTARIRVGSMRAWGRVFELTDSSGTNIVQLKQNNTSGVLQLLGSTSANIGKYKPGRWETYTFALDGATGGTKLYRDGVLTQTVNTNSAFSADATLGNMRFGDNGGSIDLRALEVHSRQLSEVEAKMDHLRVSATHRLAADELQVYANGERVHRWDAFRATGAAGPVYDAVGGCVHVDSTVDGAGGFSVTDTRLMGLDLSSGFTFVIRLRLRELADHRSLFDLNTGGFRFRIKRDGDADLLRWYVAGYSGTKVAFAFDEWVTFAGTYDSVTSQVVYYVDGVEHSSRAHTATTSLTSYTTMEIMNGDGIKGDVSHVAFWAQPLSANQVESYTAAIVL